MSRERVTLVFNGQAYDFLELREELSKKGHPFSTRSDTEVVLRSYLEWGVDFVERVHGMYAMRCPLYRTLHTAIALTSSYELA